jgi:putative flippase GtrA
MESGETRTKRSHVVKLLRYSALSVLFTALNFVGLALLVGVLAFPAGWANFLIVGASIPLAFEMNRRWVWSMPGGPWWRSPEVIPFAAFSLTALALSTFVVHQTGLAVATWSRSGRTAAVEGASLVSFGTLWLIEYVVLDRVLFKSKPDAELV